MKRLYLPVSRQWFEMIASGEKKEEYREIKMYWTKRLFISEFDMPEGSYVMANNDLAAGFSIESVFNSYGVKIKKFDNVVFKLGYAKKGEVIEVECKGIDVGLPKAKWSGGMQGYHFIIRLGEIINNE